MKNKILACLAVTALVSMSCIMGTFANYQTSIKTGDNTITAAKFVLKGDNLDTQGTATSNISAAKPGDSGDLFFTVRNFDGSNTTETTMDYYISLSGNLANNPNIQYELYKEIVRPGPGHGPAGPTSYESVATFTSANAATTNFHDTFAANSQQTDKYKLTWRWTSHTNDFDYQGSQVKYVVNVVGKQL